MEWLDGVEANNGVMDEFNHSVPLMADEITRLRTRVNELELTLHRIGYEPHGLRACVQMARDASKAPS